MKRTIVLLIGTILLTVNGMTQELEHKSNNSKMSVGAHIGLSQSGTDTHSWGRHGSSIIEDAHLNYGLNFSYQISRILNLRANWFKTNISGDDLSLDGPCSDLNDNDVPGPCHKNRGWSFTSPLNEIGIDLEWHLFKRKHLDAAYNNSETKEQSTFSKKISPYITLGVAYAFTDPKLVFSEGRPPSDEKQKKDQEDFSSPFLQFPIGLGLQVDLNRSLSIDLEARGVFPQSDLLDGMSAVTDYNDERNNGDAYQFLSVRINYHL